MNNWSEIYNRKKFPLELKIVLENNLNDLPLIAQPDMPLDNLPIDHFAVAVADLSTLKKYWRILVDDCDASVEEPVHLWPDEVPGCSPVSEMEKKYMTTLGFGDKLIVLLAPHNNSDLIFKFLEKTGGTNAHHIAFACSNIEEYVDELNQIKFAKQITILADKDDLLKQVFYKLENDNRIIELIERSSNFKGTFTCSNIAELTKGESKNI